MTIKQLEYFMVIARNLSFTRASNEIYISQPALSRSIASLEKKLGVPLFVRDRHSVSLTPAGEVLAAELPALQEKLNMVIAAVKQMNKDLVDKEEQDCKNKAF